MRKKYTFIYLFIYLFMSPNTTTYTHTHRKCQRVLWNNMAWAKDGTLTFRYSRNEISLDRNSSFLCVSNMALRSEWENEYECSMPASFS